MIELTWSESVGLIDIVEQNYEKLKQITEINQEKIKQLIKNKKTNKKEQRTSHSFAIKMMKGQQQIDKQDLKIMKKLTKYLNEKTKNHTNKNHEIKKEQEWQEEKIIQIKEMKQ